MHARAHARTHTHRLAHVHRKNTHCPRIHMKHAYTYSTHMHTHVNAVTCIHGTHVNPHAQSNTLEARTHKGICTKKTLTCTQTRTQTHTSNRPDNLVPEAFCRRFGDSQNSKNREAGKRWHAGGRRSAPDYSQENMTLLFVHVCVV